MDPFIDYFLGFYNYFHNLLPIGQFLILVLLVAATVGSMAIGYFTIKYSILLVIWIFKAIFKAIKSIFKGLSSAASNTQNNKQQQQITTKTPATVAAQPAAQTTVKPAAQAMHCPNCGEEFTPEMQRVLSSKEETFCEFCGAKLRF